MSSSAFLWIQSIGRLYSRIHYRISLHRMGKKDIVWLCEVNAVALCVVDTKHCCPDSNGFFQHSRSLFKLNRDPGSRTV